MGSKEDTFRKLRQTPFEQVVAIVFSPLGENNTTKEILSNHGWGVREFWDKYNDKCRDYLKDNYD